MLAQRTALVLVALLPCVAAAQEIPWQAERVMLRYDGVRAGRPVAGHLVRQGKELPADSLYTVLRADGGLLELGDNCGWVARADVVRLRDAAAYFTARIKDEPTAAKWYGRRAQATTAGRLRVDLTTNPGQPRVDVGRPADQLNDLREAVRLAPTDIGWRDNLAGAYLALGDLERASEQFEAIIRQAPKDAGGYCGRALIRLTQKDAEGAVADVERASEMAPKSFATQRALALAYLHTGQKAKAEPLFRRVVEMPVATSFDYNQRAVARATTGDFDGMLTDLTEAIRLDPANAEALRTRGCLWRRRGEYQSAMADFRRAARLLHDDPTAMRMEAFLLATCKEDGLRNGKRAVELAERAVKLSGDNLESANHEALAAAYAEVGDFAAAVAAQKRSIKSLEGRPSFYDEIGGLRWWLEQYQREKPRRE